jgi:hypothetical protein
MRTPVWEGVRRQDYHLSVNIIDIYPQIIYRVKNTTPHCALACAPFNPISINRKKTDPNTASRIDFRRQKTPLMRWPR